MRGAATSIVKTCSLCNRAGDRGFAEDAAGWRCLNAAACEQRVAKAARAANADRCVDCVAEGITAERKLATKPDGSPQPGNRCVTHWRARRRTVREAAHGNRVEKKFRISAEVYWAIYAAQNGRCFICQRATGKARKLAVDHDHELAELHDHPVDEGCLECIRCLACGPCNKDVLGRLDVAALCRAIQVLTDPPARKLLAAMMADLDDDEHDPNCEVEGPCAETVDVSMVLT